MQSSFRPDGRALLIGSQPLTDHLEATRLILKHTPDIPTWAQLPAYKYEEMVAQYAPGLPGLIRTADRTYVDTGADDFDEQLLDFFEAYLTFAEQPADWEDPRFTLTPETAQGFFTLLDQLGSASLPLCAVKGHVTGPITFCTALKDQNRRAIFYHDSLRDAAVKLLALKAAWQARQLSRFGVPVIIFIDEPGLAGYGSSELISISKEQINACLQEVVAAIQGQGAMAGVHVCANTDWSLLLTSDVDIVNFDAHGYFDKFMLYQDQLKSYLAGGRLLAWGLVPTSPPELVEAATLDELWQDWQLKSAQVGALGIAPETLRAQSLLTPSCGTGSIPPALSRKVLELTQALSGRIRGG